MDEPRPVRDDRMAATVRITPGRSSVRFGVIGARKRRTGVTQPPDPTGPHRPLRQELMHSLVRATNRGSIAMKKDRVDAKSVSVSKPGIGKSQCTERREPFGWEKGDATQKIGG